MSRFIQLHILTSYAPANLNRDDLGRPKTARVGKSERLRISSQSLKRAWRTSDVFEQALDGHLGIRTKEMGKAVYQALTSATSLPDILAGKALAGEGVEANVARDAAHAMAAIFAKPKANKYEEKDGKDNLDAYVETEQLAHFSTEEVAALDALVEKVRASGKAPEEEDLDLLRKQVSAADIAMFGRMLAASPSYNVEAAVQVAHPFTVHAGSPETDFFTAVDDLNRGIEDVGAGHMGETEFGAGLFYLYICVNRELLINNLQGDAALADKALRALVEAAATVAPTGKQSSFASRARATYIRAEKGGQQPRSLSVAFLKPVYADDMHGAAVQALEEIAANMDKAYGACSDASVVMDALRGEGSLAEIQDFVGG